MTPEVSPMLSQSITPHLFGDTRLPARFWAKVNENGPIPTHRPELGPCWEWTAGRTCGYGSFQAGTLRQPRTVRAHCWAYEHLIGPIPEGLESDHLCRNPGCVRLTHIELVTHAENVRRGNGGVAARARQMAKTHCPQGHPYNATNTRRDRYAKRHCRECGRLRKQHLQHLSRNPPAKRPGPCGGPAGDGFGRALAGGGRSDLT